MMGHTTAPKHCSITTRTMHQCSFPVSHHPPQRTGAATCPRVGQHARVRLCPAGKKEGGSLVRGTGESDRIASLAPVVADLGKRCAARSAAPRVRCRMAPAVYLFQAFPAIGTEAAARSPQENKIVGPLVSTFDQPPPNVSC
jgi:hypothetical protein